MTCAYRKLISVMCSLLQASVICSFNLLVSFLCFIIWYDFAIWSRPFLILLSGDIEANLWTKFFNLSLEFKRYF